MGPNVLSSIVRCPYLRCVDTNGLVSVRKCPILSQVSLPQGCLLTGSTAVAIGLVCSRISRDLNPL